MRGLHILMRNYHRHRWAKRCLRRVAKKWHPCNQKAGDEFGPDFHKVKYRPGNSTLPRFAAGLVRCITLLSPSFQVRQERIGTHESRELGVGLLLTVPVVKNQGRWSEKPEAP